MVVENKKDIFLAISINTGLCYCDEYLICNGGTNHITRYNVIILIFNIIYI